MKIYSLENLNFAYMSAPKKLVLDNVSLEVNQGDYIAICGRSGSGKTTLLRHLKGAITPYGKCSGSVIYKDKALKDVDLRTQSSEIGFVMQNPDNQIVTDKVWHELAFGLESLSYDQNTMRTRVAEMASYFGIQAWFEKNVSELSGGQKQLLNLASIMAMQPEVIILDEPTSQLDPIAASDFLNTIHKINKELGTTIIITEHRLEEILPVADRVIIMENGHNTIQGTPYEVGRRLWEQHSEMMYAMPSPMQIYFGCGMDKDAPLTVREGRAWIDSYIEGKNVDTNIIQPEVQEDIKDIALAIKEIWYRYNKKSEDVIRGLSLNIPKGKIFSIVGGNGTGKSTLLKIICGIYKPYRGKIKVNGKISMLPQDPLTLFVKKTVREELMEMVSGNNREELIMKMAVKCSIENLLDSHPYDISGGEAQRVAIAKVMLTTPDILVLDEPTKGMDNFFKREFASILRELKAENTTIIMVSHDVEFCAKYTDHVAMLFNGDVIASNTPRRFFARNSFYTTAANRMCRHLCKYAVTNEDVIKLCGKE